MTSKIGDRDDHQCQEVAVKMQWDSEAAGGRNLSQRRSSGENSFHGEKGKSVDKKILWL